MQKLYYTFLFSIILSITAVAQTAGGDFDFETSDEDTHIPAMVLVDDGDMDGAREELLEMGAIILRERKDIMLVLLPLDYNSAGGEDEGNNDSDDQESETEEEEDIIEGDSAVAPSGMRKLRHSRIIERSRPRYNHPAMDVAKDFNNAFRINQGDELPQPFDGSGVVVGICDIGFDARHPNFLTADGKECRIRRVVQYKETKGQRKVYYTPEEIYAWETDNPDDWHATHVTGIAAGAYPNGYQGLASGADIVFTGSQLSDVGLLAGVEDIIEYAKEVKKPCVINLSMGNTLGPHDGSSLFSRYLDYCTEDAIICISAGNDGDGAGAVRHMGFDFTEAKQTVRVRTTNWDGLSNTGMAQVWSRDENPFTVSLFLFNEVSSAGHVFFEDIDFSNPERGAWRVSANEGDPDFDPMFAEYYKSGYVKITGGWSYLNGRFYAEMEFDCQTDIISPNSPNKNWAQYWPGIRVNSAPDNHIDVVIDNYNFLRTGGDTPALNNDMSISDLATGHKVISVGMAINHETIECFNGYVENVGTPGTIHPNSSYGTLLDGRVLPVTVAPGAGVISSMSSPFVAEHPDEADWCSAKAEYEGKEVYWKTNTGTSMSCPYVVGAIATWLQAYPLLSAEEALHIVQKTNTQNYPDEANPRHGQGWFNAHSGILEALELSALGIEQPVEMPGIAVKFDGRRLVVGNLNDESVRLKVYSMTGMLVKSESVREGTNEINLSDLTPGVYTAVIESAAGFRKVIKLFVK